MRLAFLSFLCLYLCSTTLASSPETLVGQKADFKLDRNPKRTTSLITDGTFLATIKDFHPDTDSGPTLEVALDYKFKIQFLGEKTGIETGLIDYQYFTSEFLEKLRKEKKYESANFKVLHQGFETVKTLQGKTYPNCDVILLYDFKDTQDSHLRSALSEFLASIIHVNATAKMEDLKVLLHLYPGIPVLGGVQIDISGNYERLAVKAGADYQEP